MAYEPTIIQRASAQLLHRQEVRARKRYELEQELYRRQPRLRQLDRDIRGTMIALAELATGGKPLEAGGPEITAVRERNQALQRERAELLRQLGCAADALDDVPACPRCGDRGWTDGGMCGCLKELCIQEQMKVLTASMRLTDDQCFDRLSLDVYSDQPWQGQARSPRENMKRVAAVCQGFARQFPDYPLKNLLLSGAPGLGKTYLSGCIARAVTLGGWSVEYETTVGLLAAFETRKFTRDQEEGRQARDEARRYQTCDLLILDDLGSEFTTTLAQTSLYEIVNSRLQADRRTIISTNLSIDQIAARYSPQLASRVGGSYQELTFYGDDIRRK